MPTVKWVGDRHELREGPTFANIAYPEDAVPVLTLDDLEAWLQQEYEASQLNGERGYVSAKDLLEHVAAMKEGRK